MVKENNSSAVRHTQRTTAGTKPKVYTPKQYTTTQSKNKKINSTVNTSSTLNATPSETLDIDLYKNYIRITINSICLWTIWLSKLRFWKKKMHL